MSQEEDDVDREILQVTGVGGEDRGEEEEPTPRSQAHSMPQGDLVHPNTVLKILRSFVDENKHPPKYVVNLHHFFFFTLPSLLEADSI